MLCKNCQQETSNPNFCSRSCSASYNNYKRKLSDTTKTKIKNSVKLFIQNNSDQIKLIIKNRKSTKGIPKKIHITKICPTCQSKFQVAPKNTKVFCSPKCIKLGGIREKSGRGKWGYYKGIYCSSTWELCWLIYQLDHNKNVIRFPMALSQKNKTYIPDFYFPDENKIIEIKGFDQNNSMQWKEELARSLGYNIKTLYKNDLTHIFSYIKEKYKTSKYEELYD